MGAKKHIRGLSMFSLCVNAVLFVCVVCLISLDWSESEYVANSAAKALVIADEQPDQSGFLDIQTTADFYTWVRSAAISSLFLHQDQSLAALRPGSGPPPPPSTPQSDSKTHFFPYGRTYLLGPLRLRQTRARAEPCEFNALQGVTLSCYVDESHETYGLGEPAFVWQDTEDRSYAGILDSYPPGGFVANLDVNISTATQVVDHLEAAGWIDIGTLAVFVDFTIYNAELNVLVHGTLLMEQPAASGVVPSYQFHVVSSLFESAESHHELFVLLRILFGAAAGLLLLNKVRQVWVFGPRFLLSGWSLIDFALIASLIMYLVFFIVLEAHLPRVRAVAKANEGRYVSLADIIYFSRGTSVALMGVAMCLCLRFMRYATLHPQVTVYLYMMSGVFSSLLAFLVLFAFIALGFSFVGHLMFRKDIESYSTLGRALYANLGALLGDTDYDELHESNRWYAYIFYAAFSITAAIFLLNLVVSVLSDEFNRREEDARAKTKVHTSHVHAQLRSYARTLSCGRLYPRGERDAVLDSISDHAGDANAVGDGGEMSTRDQLVSLSLELASMHDTLTNQLSVMHNHVSTLQQRVDAVLSQLDDQ